MAQTNIPTTSDLARILFKAQEVISATKGTLWQALMGSDENAIIQTHSGLKKKGAGYILKGIYIFSGEPTTGTTGTTSTEFGKEEPLAPDTDSLTLEFFQKGFGLGHVFQEQYLLIDLMKASSGRFKRWLENLINDRVMADLLNSPADTFFPTTNAGQSIATLDSTDVLAVDDLSKWQAILEDGDNGSYEPFRPGNILGETDMYGVVVHPRASSQLKQTSDWKTLWQNAQLRGSGNPIWQGYLKRPIVGEYDGMAVVASRRVPYFTNGGSGGTQPYCTGVIVGAQAAQFAHGMIDDQEVVYKDPTGVIKSVYRNTIFGSKATEFDSTQYGTVGLNVSCS